MKKLFQIYLQPLIKNSACYTINLYDYEMDRLIQIRDIKNFNYDTEMSFFGFQSVKFAVSLHLKRISRFIDNLLKAPIADNAIREMLVVKELKQQIALNSTMSIAYDELYAKIEKFQRTNKGDVIWFYNTTPLDWVPFHRSVHFEADSIFPKERDIIFDAHLQSLVDLIKNPDFNRYDFTYQSIRFSEKLFNASCMEKIHKIHVCLNGQWEDSVILPTIWSIMKKENERRNTKDSKPLEIILDVEADIFKQPKWYPYWYFQAIEQLQEEIGEKNMKFVQGDCATVRETTNRLKQRSLYFAFFTSSYSTVGCRMTYYKRILYQLPMAMEYFKFCSKAEVFESTSDLMDLMNRDICNAG